MTPSASAPSKEVPESVEAALAELSQVRHERDEYRHERDEYKRLSERFDGSAAA